MDNSGHCQGNVLQPETREDCCTLPCGTGPYRGAHRLLSCKLSHSPTFLYFLKCQRHCLGIECFLS
ncbi:hypothetical protein BIW11_10781 [Tropilaelaps mercedesae]|uniref:Uncharacterized protein n=1 Tax=Tropilaelaps mercedesae TaxID=418985 RepID=A0A1V9XE18_9ACAR|nr:hypothetical protein BIW11_10781 [Tropilaelaps mercedesae]